MAERHVRTTVVSQTLFRKRYPFWQAFMRFRPYVKTFHDTLRLYVQSLVLVVLAWTNSLTRRFDLRLSVIIFLATSFFIFNADSAQAANLTGAVSYISCVGDSTNYCTFGIVGQSSTACTGSPAATGKFIFTASSAMGQNWVRIITSAFLSGANFTVAGAGSCTTYVGGQWENVSQVQLGP